MAARVKELIEAANKQSMQRILDAQPTWVDVQPAREFIPGFADNLILIAGPTLDPKEAKTPTRNSICGAAVHEGLAKDMAQAWQMVLAGEIIVEPLQGHLSAGGAGYAVSASTPVQVALDPLSGARGCCAFQEGNSPESLRWGMYNAAIEKKLSWLREELGPVLGAAIRGSEGINIRNILARAESMGDENHSRQVAASGLLLQQLIPLVMDVNCAEKTRSEVVKFLCGNERFFLHIFIAGVVAVMEAAKNVEYSTVVVGFGGNGTDFGIKVSGMGDEWFSAPCPSSKGMLLNPEWTEADTSRYFGDSCIVETYGFGGPSAAAGPMVVRLYGGNFDDAMQRTEDYREISLGSHDWAPIPWMGYQGPPVGIDIRKVIATGIAPTIHGGIGHVNGGQAGAGAMIVPMECFVKALKAFGKKYNIG